MLPSRILRNAVTTTTTAIRRARRRRKPETDKLQKTLEWLQKEPRPVLPNVQSLVLTYTSKNAHFGARHFAKEDLPRISYANQDLKIEVDRKLPVEGQSPVQPVMTVKLKNGEAKSIDMASKSSQTILDELMAINRRT
ncbi:hypothetical protein CPB86DRAFT_810876 [Serendipita vermifera]|nr:hypothetical protein CPB86DRAFT_810876 [Serendipita vermifera]